MASKFSTRSHLPISCLLFIMLILSSRPVTAQSQQQTNSSSQFGYFNQSNFTPSMAIVLIVLISVFFFLGFFSIYVRQCASEGLGGTGPAIEAPTANRQPRGLDPTIIESLPTMVYSEVKEHKVGKGALECAVCLSEFEDDETLTLLPKCSHVFHTDCIDAWLVGHVTCPVCRYNLMDYKKGEMPLPSSHPAAMVVDSESTTERAAETSRQVEERSGEPPMVLSDAVVLEVKPETEEERREREEAEELERIASRRRALRSKSSRRPMRFPRSHSTGHSLSSADRTGDDMDRYTLRIPEPVLRRIIADGKLKRTTSLLYFGEAGEGSSRPGYRGNGEGSSRGGRSVRLFVRNLSEKFFGRRGDGEGSVKGEGATVRGKRGSVRVQFDCLAGGAASTDKAESGEGSVGRMV